MGLKPVQGMSVRRLRAEGCFSCSLNKIVRGGLVLPSSCLTLRGNQLYKQVEPGAAFL